MSGGLAVLGAPSAIGLVPDENGEPRRLDLAPGALRDAGLVARLGARDLGDVPPPRYRDLERPKGRIRNDEELAAYVREIAERVAESARSGEFVVLLGGDCSVVLGALLGLRAVDPAPPGLVYLDAHADFATLDESPSGSACSMALALAAGRAEEPLARLGGEGPLTSGDRVAHIGRRPSDPAYGAAALEPCGVLDLPRPVVASAGAARVAEEALARVGAQSAGFWIHFDVDVLDPDVMPATGDRAPSGIDFDEAAGLLEPFVRHPAARGLQLTLYDPTLDANGSAASDLVELLRRAAGVRGISSRAR